MGILEIIGIIIGFIIIISIVAALIRMARIGGSAALKPDGEVTGKALVVYDPGMTGGTKNAAFYMAEELKARSYEVKVAGVKSSDALDLSGYDVLVIGSPTYGANPTGAVKAYLNALKVPENIVTGVYSLAGSDAQDSNAIMAQTLEDKSANVKVSTKYGSSVWGAPSDKTLYSNFVAQLLG